MSNVRVILQELAATRGVKFVRCGVCKKAHRILGDDYIVIYGDIHIGAYNRVVGDNFVPLEPNSAQFRLKSIVIVCRGTSYVDSCLSTLLKRIWEIT
jgi:hypothetical protein